MGVTSITICTPWTDHLELASDYFTAVSVMKRGDEVVIVDNASTPPLEFGTVYSDTNLGFCDGCNIGLKHATKDAVLFLNNDISILRSHWLEEIRETLEPGVIVGPMREGRHTSVDGESFPYIDGWCLAGMREDLLALGGFDETLAEPAYFSDNLLCLEARAQGMSLRDVRVGLRHKLNSTAGPAWDDRVRAATQINQARYEARVRELTAAVP